MYTGNHCGDVPGAEGNITFYEKLLYKYFIWEFNSQKPQIGCCFLINYAYIGVG
jgi:hypothetical protein